MPGSFPPHCLAPRLYRASCASRGSPQRSRAQLHTSHASYAQQPNFYQVLEVAQTASHTDIKKQYYKLSKANHPDLNPKDQEAASKKFVAISDAYHVLGDPEKRQKYDREITPEKRRSASGSYSSSSSSSSAGGRPATGLSKRRTTFRGPPPSFYRSGAYGEQARKRETAGDTDGRRAQAEFDAYHKRKQEAKTQGGSSKQSPWPFDADLNDVPHFNRDLHYRTTTSIEEQLRKGRQQRRSAFNQQIEDPMFENGAGDSARSFFMVTGVLLLGIGGSVLLFSFPSAGG